MSWWQTRRLRLSALSLLTLAVAPVGGCSSSEEPKPDDFAGRGGTAAVGLGGQAQTGGTGAGVAAVGATGGASGTTAATGAGGTGGAAGTGGASGSGGTGSAGVTGGSGGTGGTGGAGGAADGGAPDADAGALVVGPCDIYRSGGTPCVAAHSTVRALFGAYSGKLYQVRRADDATLDVMTLTAGGFADGASQDSFCNGSSCVITVLYDQSGMGNDLWYQGSAEVPGSVVSIPATADKESLTVGGHAVYALNTDPHVSYWRDGSQTGMPKGTEPEGMYMVTSGTHYNGGCCFDYGNSETTRTADAAGAMDAIYFGSSCWFGGCFGSGPWVQADLEWGLYPGGSQQWNTDQRAFAHDYVTAMLKNDGTTRFALKGADAQSEALTTLYDGSLPNGYSPMKKQGAIVLGSGGDCCKPGGGANDSEGTFYEGAIVAGYPTDATDDAIQANIAAAGYGKP